MRTPFHPPAARPQFEPLESRLPVSSFLDALLGGAWLSADRSAWQPEPSPTELRSERVEFARALIHADTVPLTVAPTTTSDAATTPRWLPDTPNSFASLVPWDSPAGQALFALVVPQPRPAPTETSPLAAANVEFTAPPSRPVTSAPTPGFVTLATDDAMDKFLVDAQPTLMNNPAPSLTLTGDAFVPVNANNTNGSKWKSIAHGQDPSDKSYVQGQDLRELKGIPLMRDFGLNPMWNLSAWDGTGKPPAGPAIPDPDLKPFTATVSPGGTQVKITVRYNSATEGGRVSLWKQATKEIAIPLTPNADGKSASGTLPSAPTHMFFVEGMRPSKSLNDITIEVETPPRQVGPPPIQTIPAMTASKQISVTPIVDLFKVTPESVQTSFVRDNIGRIIGMTSGKQSADGAPGYDAGVGVTFEADLIRTNIQGEGKFVQVVTGFSNDLVNNKGVILDDATKVASFEPIGGVPLSNVGLSLPLIDSEPGDIPFYASKSTTISSGDRHAFSSVDSPMFHIQPDQLNKLHPVTKALVGTYTIAEFGLTFQPTLYLTWVDGNDGSIYTLASISWKTVFKAKSVSPNTGLVRDPSSVTKVISPVDPTTISLTNTDPLRMSEPRFEVGLFY